MWFDGVFFDTLEGGVECVFTKQFSVSVFPMFRYGQVLFDTQKRLNIIKSVTGWRHRASKNQCVGRDFSNPF